MRQFYLYVAMVMIDDGRSLMGISIMDNIQWRMNGSYLIDKDILYRRVTVTSSKLNSLALYGAVEVVQEWSCDSKFSFAFYPIKMQYVFSNHATFSSQGLTYSSLTSGDAVPPMFIAVRNALTDCFPLFQRCPFTTGLHVLNNCTYAEFVNMPDRRWNLSLVGFAPDGGEMVSIWIEFHLDDTPILRARRPSEVQRRERKRQGKKPVVD